MCKIDFFLNSINNLSNDDLLNSKDFIKKEMKAILEHYVECKRGYHYNVIFQKIIKPFLDSVTDLEIVLKSDVIKDKSNVVIGKTGSKIFPELYKKLIQVESESIKVFLMNEFNLKDYT